MPLILSRNVELLLRRLYSHCREVSLGQRRRRVAAFGRQINWVTLEFLLEAIQQFQFGGHISQQASIAGLVTRE